MLAESEDLNYTDIKTTQIHTHYYTCKLRDKYKKCMWVRFYLHCWSQMFSQG